MININEWGKHFQQNLLHYMYYLYFKIELECFELKLNLLNNF